MQIPRSCRFSSLLAGLAVGHLHAVVVDNLDLVIAANRRARTVKDQLIAVIEASHVQQALAGAEILLKLTAKLLADAAAQATPRV